jgi:hypothetical protein
LTDHRARLFIAARSASPDLHAICGRRGSVRPKRRPAVFAVDAVPAGQRNSRPCWCSRTQPPRRPDVPRPVRTVRSREKAVAAGHFSDGLH